MAVFPDAEPAMALHPYDLYDVRSLLSEEERAVQDTVARFTDERVLPIIGDAFDEGRFPNELIPEIAELGLLGSSLPEQYGGAGLNAVSYGLICQELERGDSGIRSFVSVQSLAVHVPDLRLRHARSSACAGCRDMAAGKVIGCFGLTEPHGGSDPANMKTNAQAATAATGSSTAPRCGSPTATSPTSRSSGRRPTTASRASSSRRACPASPPRKSSTR